MNEPSDLLYPPVFSDALDTVDREVRAPAVIRVLRKRQLSPDLARLAVTGLTRYLEGDVEQAARMFEAIVDELRERTMTISRNEP